MFKILQRFHPISLSVTLYWALFWLLNGIDKFANGKTIFGIVWYGKNRTEQFTGYCERLGLSTDVIPKILSFSGVWEIGVALFYLAALSRPKQDKSLLGLLAVLGSFATFIAFCVFDIVVGDRAELLEHSTYIGVLLVSYVASEWEKEHTK